MSLRINKETKIALTLFALATAGYFLKYGLNIYLARHLTESLYGDFSLAVKCLNILSVLSLFGTQVGAQRFLANYLQLNQTAAAADYIAWNIKLIRVSFSIMLGIALISLTTMSILHYVGIKHIRSYHLTVYMLWVTPFAAFSALLGSFLLCTGRIYLSISFSNISRYLIEFILFVLIASIFSYTLDSITIAFVVLFSFLLISGLSLLTLNEDLLQMIKSGLKQMTHTKILRKEWFIVSSRLISNNIIFIITSTLDLIFVKLFTSSEASVAHYAAVLTICGLIWLPPMNLYGALKSKASALLATKEGRDELQGLLDRTNAVVMAITACLTLIIIYFAHALLSHFGPHYGRAMYVLMIMALGSCVGGMLRFSSSLLVYAGYERLLMIFESVQFIAMFLFVIPATYFFNITGTAIATALIICTKAIAVACTVRKTLHLRSALFM